ncbi:MAG: hypothetical protein WC444_05625 [Candidatus Paceibacterota bacterium]
MRKVSDMIGIRGGKYYLKEAVCPKCGDSYSIPLSDSPIRCVYCKRMMNYRFKCLGDTLDFEESLHKTPRQICKEVGKSPSGNVGQLK